VTTLETKPLVITAAPVKRVALVLRVSTDRQARNEEGSLKNQLQRLRQHIEYKNGVCGENWTEAGLYELKGISGKNSMRSQEFERLFNDIRAGRVNTILCTALDRICRSVKDFLWFFEFLNEQQAEFVCLKQNYDTTSAQGRLFVTMMMALAEFEREQTSERTRDATAARSERGLWNGGRLLGYDTDPNKKSTLIPNHAEALVVNLAFDKYLECGSLKETADTLNSLGYRTKSYTSRRDVYHPGGKFYVSMVQYLLRNPAYAGKKEINKLNIHKKNCGSKEYRLVEASWPEIVSPEKFEAVQLLMQENGQTNRNAAEPVQHAYVLSHGILHCGRCGGVMNGRSGTGRLGTKYFYYGCPKCGLKVNADEVETAVLERVKTLATDDAILQRLTDETNARLLKQKPDLEKQKLGLIKAMADVKNQADKLLDHLPSLKDETGSAFVREKLAFLAERRRDLENGIAQTDDAITRIQEQSVKSESVKLALSRINEIYTQLKPFERRDLMGMLLKSAKINERSIELEIYTLNETQMESLKSVNQGELVRTPPNWLLD
jgi:site-specific DNA recombinase